MECKFVVGQKVVCATNNWDDFGGHWGAPAPVPAKGDICTIVQIKCDPVVDEFAFKGIYLLLCGYYDVAFIHAAFRPLNNRPTETDIAVFRKMLDPTKCKFELEDA